MNHYALNSWIAIASRKARAQRTEATRLIIKGRKFCREGRALGAEKPNSDPRGTNLLKAGKELNQIGCRLIGNAEDGRWQRRHWHLAAALLNGKTYFRCEAKINEQKTGKADSSLIADAIQLHLPLDLQTYALFIAKEWLLRGGLTLRATFRDTQRLAALDKAKVDFAQTRVEKAKLERERTWSTNHLKRAQAALDEAVAQVASLTSRWDDLQLRMAKLEGEIRQLEPAAEEVA